MLMYMYLYMFLPISTLYPSRKMRFKRRAEVGLPVKGMKPLKKLEKNFPYLLCQHSDFGADTAAGCAERDGRSPAKLHRQSVVRSHGGTGKVRYKKETNADKIYLVANHRGVDSFYGFDGLAL